LNDVYKNYRFFFGLIDIDAQKEFVEIGKMVNPDISEVGFKSIKNLI